LTPTRINFAIEPNLDLRTIQYYLDKH